MVYQITYYISYISFLFASICIIYRFKRLDTASKILSVLICCAFIDESAAYFLAKKYHNNLALYNIYSLIELGLLCFYFNKVIDVFGKRNIGIYIGITGIVLGIINLVFIQPINSFNSYFLLLEGLLVIGMCLFAFFRMLLKYDSLKLLKYHHFWFISILVFFWSITFLSWGLYDYINRELQQNAIKIDIALLIVNTITYVCLGCVFLLYPKMKSINE